MSEKNTERRVFDAEMLGVHVEKRDDGPSMIVGRIPYNVWSKDLGGFKETVRSSAFETTIAEGGDVKARVEHKGGLSLIGRTKNGTLRLTPTDTALEWEVEPPDTSAGRDILELAQRGDIDTASFAFRKRPGGDRWTSGDDGLMRRELLDVELVDVAPTSSPAYEDLSIAARSMEEAMEGRADEDAGEDEPATVKASVQRQREAEEARDFEWELEHPAR